MTVEISFQWWMVALLITIASFAWAIPVRKHEKRHGDYTFNGLESLIRTVGALILSLVIWLIWSLFA